MSTVARQVNDRINVRKCKIDLDILRQRRAAMAKQMLPNSALIIPAHPESIRNHDVHNAYRPDSSFVYFTGFEEPEAVFILRPGATPEYALFVREKNAERETWDGFRFGPNGAEQLFGADKAYKFSEFPEVCAEFLKSVDHVYYRQFWHHEFDNNLEAAMKKALASLGRSGKALPTVVDPTAIIGELRLFKRDDEIALLRKAGQVSAQMHRAVMRYIQPGVNERQVAGLLNYVSQYHGCDRQGYNAIVATGANATTLHYTFNDCECRDGEFLLVDAGAEYQYYTGDITRTFPVNGKFTATQKAFYGGVLRVQKAMVAAVKPGENLEALQTRAVQMLVDLMIELRLLSGAPSEIIAAGKYKKYYPHNLAHWLGLDVHDAGAYKAGGVARSVQPGMVFTIEPGLYVPVDDSEAPAEFRGMGVRIEDDVLVTATGCEVLTAHVPKEIEEIEALMSEPWDWSEAHQLANRV